MVSKEIKRSKLAAKKLWRIIRLAFLLIKKGLISKRKLILDLNLNLNRRLIFRKPPPMRKIFFYHRTSDLFTSPRHGRDYEFSCSSNSPDMYFSRVASKIRKNYHLSCLASPYSPSPSSSVIEDEEKQNAVVLLTADQYDAFSDCLYGGEDEEVPTVDDDAEEFINRFYEQLRSQNTQYLLA